MRKRLIYIFFLGLIQSVNSYGQSWHDVEGGVRWGNNDVAVLGVDVMATDTFHNYLYVGGGFDSAGHKPVINLARWDGSAWYNVCNIIDTTPIVAMCMYNKNLVIGLYPTGTIEILDSVGDVLDSFLSDGFVNTLAVYNGELYAGGGFYTIDGVSATAIARYNGSVWKSVDSGMQAPTLDPEILALYVWSNNLYAAGIFNKAGDSLANNIAVWNDTIWKPLGSGTNTIGTGGYNDGYIYSVGAYNNDLYIGGQFDLAGGIASKWLARWNGTKWDSVGGGVNNPVYSFIQFKNNFYMGGVFDSAGNMNIPSITSWNDTVFSNIGSGIAGSVFAMDTFNKSLYVGGLFKNAGGTQAYNIARWGADTTTGIKTVKVTDNVIIYPNPSDGTFNLISPSEINEIRVTDLLGQEVYRVFPNQQHISFKLLGVGIYFVTIMFGGQSVTTELVTTK